MTVGESSNVVVRFYSWWIGELSKAFTPPRSSERGWRTLLQTSPEGLEITSRGNGASRHVGTLREDASPEHTSALRRLVMAQAETASKEVLLRLSPDEVVERTIQIPEAASDVIEPVLENQMERIVPWAQSDTSYGYRIVGPNSAAPDQLDIRVVATTRKILDKALLRANSVGLAPYAIEFKPASDTEPAVQLMSMEPDPVKTTSARLQNFLALVLAVVVAAGGFGLYHVWERQSENDELEARIATAKSRVEEVKRLNDENATLREQRERLAKRKTDDPAVIGLVEALSRALPDNVFLTELEVHGREMRMVGKSADPTTLITMLEATPQFADVRFAAPTTREEGETVGTFSIIGKAEGGAQLEDQE